MKFDELTDEDPKVISAIAQAGESAGWLWFRSVLYAAKAMTDGFIPEAKVAEFRQGKRRNVAALLACGLWEKVADGYQVRNFLDHNETAAVRKEARRKAADRVRRFRERQGSNAGVTPLQDRSGNAAVRQQEVEEEVRREEPKGSSRPDIEHLCSLLADLIEANGSKRPTISQAWRDAARRLLDLDGRSQAEAERLIRWAQASTFWQPNVMSMPKFREKYDQLRLQAGRDATPYEHPADRRDRELAAMAERLKTEEAA